MINRTPSCPAISGGITVLRDGRTRVSLQPVTAGSGERQALTETIQAQWALLADLDLDALLRAVGT
jgi:hypothetical protein